MKIKILVLVLCFTQTAADKSSSSSSDSDEGSGTSHCMDPKYIQACDAEIPCERWLTREPSTAEYVRFRSYAETVVWKYPYVHFQIKHICFVPPPPALPVTALDSCKTKSELLYGYWKNDATFCYILSPYLQNVRRATCQSNSCCKDKGICLTDGNARLRFWVYCAYFNSPYSGRFYLKYQVFPQCCTCRQCDHCQQN